MKCEKISCLANFKGSCSFESCEGAIETNRGFLKCNSATSSAENYRNMKKYFEYVFSEKFVDEDTEE